MRLKGKTAIITGGGRGLGRATAIAMAREGAAVVIISRTTDEIKDAGAAIQDIGGRVFALAGDIADAEIVTKTIEAALVNFGSIDILVNNAAIVGPFKPLWQVTPEEWKKRMAVNVNAPHRLSCSVIPQMIKQGGGKIVNITSGLAERVMSPFGVYSVSKAALNHLTRIMAAELRQFNIQVNGMNPGVMDTKMQEEIRQAGPELLGEHVFGDFKELKERGLLVPAERVADLAVFLGSADSDAITGMIGTVQEYERIGFRG